MGNIICVAFFFYENKVTHVKTTYELMASINYFLNNNKKGYESR